MLAAKSDDPEGVLQDKPGGSLAAWRIEINVSQQEVETEFIEGRERERESGNRGAGRLRKERRESHCFSESGGFSEDCGPMYTSFLASRDCLEQRRGPKC